MADRTIKPEVSNTEHLTFIDNEEYRLSNNFPVYFIQEPSQSLIKIEFLFYAGSFFQEKKLTAAVTANLLKEGTNKRDSSEISEIFDYYGVYANFEPQKDVVSVSLFVLEKHLEPVLQLMEEIFKQPSFPGHELQTCLENLKDKHIVNCEKVINISRMHFVSIIYGESHPYGRLLKVEDFDNICRDDLLGFHEKFYNSNNAFCIIAGSKPDKILPLFEKYLGGNDWKGNNYKTIEHKEPIAQNIGGKHFILKENALQSAIRIGKICPGINSPDYHKLTVTNVILGGYFGSRLMKNIRQEKGYTYGINSSVVSLLNGAYFFISSQVGVELCSKAVDEIYNEVKKLRTYPVSDEELTIVRNYLYGNFLRSFDGVFVKADRLKDMIAFGLDKTHFLDYLDTLKSITAEDIMCIADKYLNENSLIELIVGKK